MVTSYFVTGASGFVGQHLMKELRQRRLPVVGVSRKKQDGLIRIPSYGADMDWEPLLEGVDTVVHLAARVHVMRDRARDPLAEFRKANIEPTLHLARAAVRSGVRRFVFVSTIKVNGETTTPGHPFTADDFPSPQGAYATSKAEAETSLLRYGQQSGLQVGIIRPPLVYGPGVRGNLQSLARWGRLGLPSPFGLVKNKRHLVHVSSLCDAIIAVSKSTCNNEVFLVADANSISTNELLLALGWSEAPHALDLFFAWTLHPLLKIRKSAWQKLSCSLELDTSKTTARLGWQATPFNSDALKRSGEAPL